MKIDHSFNIDDYLNYVSTTVVFYSYIPLSFATNEVKPLNEVSMGIETGIMYTDVKSI